MTNERITLTDLVSGIVEIRNDDGFPLESMPQKGTVQIRFGTGYQMQVTADADEFAAANTRLRHTRACMQCGSAYVETGDPWPMQPYCHICKQL